MIIKIYGPGCAKCGEAENMVRKVVRETGSDATVEKSTDLMEMMGLGIMSTPAVAIDGKVVLAGRVPTRDDVITWLGAAHKN